MEARSRTSQQYVQYIQYRSSKYMLFGMISLLAKHFLPVKSYEKNLIMYKKRKEDRSGISWDAVRLINISCTVC